MNLNGVRKVKPGDSLGSLGTRKSWLHDKCPHRGRDQTQREPHMQRAAGLWQPVPCEQPTPLPSEGPPPRVEGATWPGNEGPLLIQQPHGASTVWERHVCDSREVGRVQQNRGSLREALVAQSFVRLRSPPLGGNETGAAKRRRHGPTY